MPHVKAAAVLSALILSGAFAGAAEGATVRITPIIKGAGTVEIVEGGGSVFTPICTNSNTDDRVTKNDCPQAIRVNDTVSILNVAIRATPLGSPAGHWFFVPGWLAGTCNMITVQNYCVLQSAIFGDSSFSPMVIFDDVASPGLVTFVTASYSDVADRTITVSMVWNEPVDAQCRIDGGTPVACTADVTPFTLSEGDHTLDARAFDKSGNQSGFSSQHQFKIVDTAITSGPANGITTGPDVTFTYSTIAGIAYDCALDLSGFADCGSASSHSYLGLGNGQHTFYVRAKNGGSFDHVAATRGWSTRSRRKQRSRRARRRRPRPGRRRSSSPPRSRTRRSSASSTGSRGRSARRA
jgi:hypothetical protein